MSKISGWDRFTMAIAPAWTLERMRARAVGEALATRNYEAAAPGRRTSGWSRNRGDVNAILTVAGPELRMHARDLLRNNSFAKRAQRVIANNTIGWGIVPKATDSDPRLNTEAARVWKAWADSTGCDAEGRLTFAGLQALAMRAIFSDGEVLIRRRFRRPEDGFPLPVQIQILEADFLDMSKNGVPGIEGGPIVNGVEFDAIGRRVAYWLFQEHPGSAIRSSGVSRRVRASEILHVYYSERPGAVRGISWLGSAIVTAKDLDEYEDAELMKQKIAACFAAFVTDTDGVASPLGAVEGTTSSGVEIESLEPGMIKPLRPGQDITIASPPAVTSDNFVIRNQRKIAAGLGVTYEDLTGDYSQVNFSSARMGRLVHQANVRDWQAHMVIPQLCAGVWAWAMEAAVLAGEIKRAPGADWTAPPLPMIEPDKEGLAYQRLVRGGTMTFSEMIREQGGDPEAHWAEYAADLVKLDALKIQLDSDVRAVSQAGLTQMRVGAAPKPTDPAPPEAP